MIRSYFKKSLEYLAGNVANKLIYIVLLPLFTRLMAPRVYAVYSNLVIFIAFLSLLYFLGIQQAVFSYFYKEKTKSYKFTLISSIYLTLLVTGIVLSLLIIRFREDLALLIVRERSYGRLFLYVAAILFFDSIHGITQSILNILERSTLYVILGFIKHFLFLGLVIGFAVAGTLSLNGIFQAMAITSLVSFLIALGAGLSLLKEFSTSGFEPRYFSPGIIRPVLSFGLIMIPGTMAMMILRLSDRYMLTYLSVRELYDVGIYAIGYRVGMIMSILTSLISMVYFPYAMRISDQPRSEVSYRKMYSYFAFLGGFLGFTVILLSPELFRLFIDSSYREGARIVFCGVISHFLLGIFNLINLNFYARKEARNIALAVITGALLNILLNFILIPSYGIYGAGMASIISYLLIVLINFMSIRIKYGIKYSVGLIIYPLLVLLMISSVNFLLPFSLFYSSLKIIFILVLAILLYYRMIRKHDFLKLLRSYFHGS